jgi:hypothetical protein
MDQTFSIFIDELTADEELRYSFLRSPRGTLRMASEWGLPLCDSEISSLIAIDPSIWERVAETLMDRTQES